MITVGPVNRVKSLFVFSLVLLGSFASMPLVQISHAQANAAFNVQRAGAAWSRTYGGGNVFSVKQTSDGGYILTGGARILKLDQLGNIVWQKYYSSGGVVSLADFSAVKQTSDGGYVASGDLYALKTDSNGNVVWSMKYYKGHIHTIEQTPDGGYFAVGSFTATGYAPYGWVAKLDAFGNVTWQKSYSGIQFAEEFFSGQQTSDGGYVVAGWRHNYDPFGDTGQALVMKLDVDGRVIWQYLYGTTDSGGRAAYSVRQFSEGGYVVLGRSFNGTAWLLRLDESGGIVWDKYYLGMNEMVPGQVSLTSDGGYVLSGNDGAGVVVRLDSTGGIVWARSLGGGGFAASVEQTIDGGYIMGGLDFSFRPGYSDVWVVKLTSQGRCCHTVADPRQKLSIAEENTRAVVIPGESTLSGANISAIPANLLAVSTNYASLSQCEHP